MLVHYVEKKSQFFFISNFLSKIEVFRTFLKIVSLDLAENPYLDRLDHYLQLSNWLHVPKNFGSRAIIWRRSKNRRFGLSLENA